MRIRTIKPEFWTDKKVASWDHFTRLLYIGLWSAADDHGRGSAEAARLAAELFPYDLSRDPIEILARVAASLDTIAKSGRIALYAVDSERFYEVAHWSRHQRVDNAGKPKVPAPSEGSPVDPREIRRDSPRSAAGTGIREQGDGTGIREQVGAQSATEPADEKSESPKKYTQARIVLHALNEAAGRHYRETETNLDFIRCRLEEPDVTVDGCIAMIRRQVARWGSDPKMAEFLRPETLFNRTKFDSYYANRDLPAETAGNGNGQRIGGPNLNAHVAGVADRIRERREQWDREDPDAPPPGFEREPKLALPGLGSNGNPPQG